MTQHSPTPQTTIACALARGVRRNEYLGYDSKDNSSLDRGSASHIKSFPACSVQNSATYMTVLVNLTKVKKCFDSRIQLNSASEWQLLVESWEMNPTDNTGVRTKPYEGLLYRGAAHHGTLTARARQWSVLGWALQPRRCSLLTLPPSKCCKRSPSSATAKSAVPGQNCLPTPHKSLTPLRQKHLKKHAC